MYNCDFVSKISFSWSICSQLLLGIIMLLSMYRRTWPHIYAKYTRTAVLLQMLNLFKQTTITSHDSINILHAKWKLTMRLIARNSCSLRASPSQYVGPRRYRPAACNVSQLPNELNAVVISHSHYDHLVWQLQMISSLTNWSWSNYLVIVCWDWEVDLELEYCFSCYLKGF